MFHELLDRYEAKAIVAFPEQLLPETVAEVLRKVPQILTEAGKQGTKLNARELIDKAAEAIEQDKDRPRPSASSRSCGDCGAASSNYPTRGHRDGSSRQA
jgi:hypothetical protein